MCQPGLHVHLMRGDSLRYFILVIGLLFGLASATFAADKLPRPIVTGLKNPAAVAIGANNRTYITVMGEGLKDGDGSVVVMENGNVKPFASGLGDPNGIVAWSEWLFVADKHRIWRIDKQGNAEVFAAEKAFPSPPIQLAGLTIDEEGTLYVSDYGDFQGDGGAIFRIDQKGKVRLVADQKRIKELHRPVGIIMDGLSHLLVIASERGELHRIRVADGSTTMLADGLGAANGLAWDKYGRLFISEKKEGRVFVIPRPGERPIQIATGFICASGLCVAAT